MSSTETVVKKVGIDKFQYKNIPQYPKQWINPSNYLPLDGDLCNLLLSDGNVINGWAYGRVWDGLHLRNDHEIVGWKRVIT